MVGKSGKTTLFYELAKTDYVGGLDKALLVGFEDGFKALRGINAISINTWKEFTELVDELCTNKKSHTFEWIGLDTLDYLYDYATDFIVRRERVARKDAKIKQISDIPWGAGYKLVSDEVDSQIKKLQAHGFGLFAITHDKEKKIELKSGESYDKTTLTLSNRAKDLFVNMADFITYISIEKEVDGDNSVKENRWIYFRSDGNIEAGSRFTNIVERVPYGADNFLKAFEDAVLSSYDGDEDAKDEAKKEQKEEKLKEIEKIEDEAKEEIEKAKEIEESMTDADMIELIGTLINDMDDTQKDDFKVKIKSEFGKINYKKYDSEQLAQALQIAKNI
jgi:hypothetical protein